ncbi:MAG TPA: hypothetical protein VGC65_04555 [Bacteroidia bacterium]|jgi:hypothetical protein
MENSAIKNCILLFSFIVIQTGSIPEPQVYDNFEGIKFLQYGTKNPTLDTVSKNPAPNKINSTGKCAKYTRNATKKFDNIKMSFVSKIMDVSPYATYVGVPPKIKIKIYTNAPVGTLVEILLGSKGRNSEYPEGTNSQYQAHTTVQNEWEELEFKFAQIPEGSKTSTMEVDQLTLLFNPNSATSDTYYFDEITGPALDKLAVGNVKDEKKKK